MPRSAFYEEYSYSAWLLREQMGEQKSGVRRLLGEFVPGLEKRMVNAEGCSRGSREEQASWRAV